MNVESIYTYFEWTQPIRERIFDRKLIKSEGKRWMISLNSCIKYPGNAGSFENKEGGDNWLIHSADNY